MVQFLCSMQKEVCFLVNFVVFCCCCVVVFFSVN